MRTTLKAELIFGFRAGIPVVMNNTIDDYAQFVFRFIS